MYIYTSQNPSHRCETSRMHDDRAVAVLSVANCISKTNNTRGTFKLCSQYAYIDIDK